MKKSFINDMVGFFVLLFLLFSCLSLLCLSLAYAHTQPDPSATRVLCSIVFGSSSLLCLLWLLLRTEIIFINSTRVVCFAFMKKISVDISNVIEIKNVKKLTYGIDGHRYECWQILDFSGRSISIVQTKRREKLMNAVKDQIEKQP